MRRRNTIRKQNQPAQSELVRRRLDDLTSHPRQRLVFDDLSDTELRELADSIATGLQHPVHIQPTMLFLPGISVVRRHA